MSLLTGDDFEDEEIEHEKVKQAFQQGNFYFQISRHILFTRFERYKGQILYDSYYILGTNRGTSKRLKKLHDRANRAKTNDSTLNQLGEYVSSLMGEITIAQDANEIGPQSLQKETGVAIFCHFYRNFDLA